MAKPTEAVNPVGPGGYRSALIATVLALIPAIATYVATSIDKVRSAKLEYVNKQIEHLYGPLYALTQADDKAWHQFIKTFSSIDRRYFFDTRNPPTIEQTDAWRVWMKTVFQPLNVKMEDAIVGNSQLVIGDKLSPVFQDLITQTEAYKAVIGSWKDADRADKTKYLSPESNTVLALNYPIGIIECVRVGYDQLKLRQQRLEDGFDFEAIFAGPLSPAPDCDKHAN
ncbi:hypothetical protein [Paraburkholderia saeva]|uniref:hypothetical protein n=1 Tax=Paraburkholderia saeva TaxID=2777537 RepID=UPI001D8F8942|nr:hypothetical protein [Paraburkholderia saeva]CAG4911675.1 hypothetical protein R52603_03950 [Paraburkholderia saeva]